MNAANFHAFKDFRKNIDIKQKLKRGCLNRKFYLPEEGFTYGKPNRPPTPIKDIINNNYGNRAEIIIRNEYKNFIKKMRSHSNFNVNKRFEITKKMIEARRKKISEDLQKNKEMGDKSGAKTAKVDKPLYKLKMFMDVGSKVAEAIKMFKSYRPFKKKIIKADKIINKSTKDINNTKIDDVINNAHGEIKLTEEQKNKYDTLPAI